MPPPLPPRSSTSSKPQSPRHQQQQPRRRFTPRLSSLWWFMAILIVVYLSTQLWVSNKHYRGHIYSHLQQTDSFLSAYYYYTGPSSQQSLTPPSPRNTTTITRCNDDDGQNNTNTQRRQVPRIIWMLWDTGFDSKSAKDHGADVSLKTWRIMNPTYDVRPLSLAQAEHTCQVKKRIAPYIWNRMRIQSQSDIIRTLLLYDNGGIWVDASLDCAVPLDTWLDDQNDLFAFQRFDKLKREISGRHKSIDPRIGSWFLVTPPKGYIITHMFNRIMYANKNTAMYRAGYFWWHKMVADLTTENEYIRRRVVMFPSADPIHCKTRNYWSTSPIFKRCAQYVIEKLVQNHETCCTRGTNTKKSPLVVSSLSATTNTTLCKYWDCRTLAGNWDLVDETTDAEERNVYRPFLSQMLTGAESKLRAKGKKDEIIKAMRKKIREERLAAGSGEDDDYDDYSADARRRRTRRRQNEQYKEWIEQHLRQQNEEGDSDESRDNAGQPRIQHRSHRENGDDGGRGRDKYRNNKYSEDKVRRRNDYEVQYSDEEDDEGDKEDEEEEEEDYDGDGADATEKGDNKDGKWK